MTTPDYKVYEDLPECFVVMKRYGQSAFYDPVYRTDTLQKALDYVNNGPWPKEFDLAGNLLSPPA